MAFNLNAEREITKEEQDIIISQRNALKKVQKIVKKYEKKKLPRDSDIYMKRLVQLSNDIYDADKSSKVKITEVYKAYFQYVLSIMYDFFNTDALEEEEKHIIAFDAMILVGLNNISLQFKEVY